MCALLYPISLLTSLVPIVWTICLSGSWHGGFLPKLLNLHVVDLHESSCLDRPVVEPSSDYGDLCSCATACSTVIERGDVFVAPC